MSETNQKNSIVKSASEGAIVERAYNKSGQIQFDAWLSREIVDYYGTIFDAEGARRYFDRFQRNPVICFNHDLNIPLGMATNPVIRTGEGIFLEGVVLSDIPVVRDTIAPLIADKVLRQMSINAAVFDYETESAGVVRFTDYLIMEGSVVTVAGNHEATIDPDTVKLLTRQLNLETRDFDPKSLEEIVSGYMDGKIVKKKVYTGIDMPQQIATPIFSIRTQPTNVVPVDTEKPGSLFYIVRRDFEGTSSDLYPIGFVNDKEEFQVSRSHMTTSLCQLFGARNAEAFSMDENVRVAAIRNILALYNSENMAEPCLGEVSLSECTDEVIASLQFRNINWKENEPRLLLMEGIKSYARNLHNGLQGVKDPTEVELRDISEQVLPLVQRWVDLYVGVSGYAYSEKEMEFWEDLIEKVKELRYPKAEDVEEERIPVLREAEVAVDPLSIPELGI